MVEDEEEKEEEEEGGDEWNQNPQLLMLHPSDKLEQGVGTSDHAKVSVDPFDFPEWNDSEKDSEVIVNSSDEW